MKSFRTHYDNLQVSENASPEVIRGAYRYLSQKWHPDKNPDNREKSERITKIINTAYEILSDPAKRKEHDLWIAAKRRSESDSRTQQAQRQSKELDEWEVNAKRWVVVGYFLFSVALLIFGLSGWFSPLGGPGWTGRGPAGIPNEYIQIFERFVAVPFSLLVVIYISPLLLSGKLMVISPIGIRFSGSGAELYRWAEVVRCEEDGSHLIIGGVRNGKKWKKRFIRSMIASDVQELVQRIAEFRQSTADAQQGAAGDI